MFTLRTRRALAGFATTALVAGGAAALAPAATSAVTGAKFTCTVSILGEKTFEVDADTNLPATITQGVETAYTFTSKVTIPADVSGAANLFFGTEVEGTATVKGTLGGASSTVTATLPKTPVPASAPLVVNISGTGTIKPTAVGASKLAVSGFDVDLYFYKNGVRATTPTTLPCKGAANVDDVTVVAPVVTPTPTPGTPTPSTPGTPTPSTPSTPTPSTPGTPTPSTPGVPTPSTPGVPTPSTPGEPAPSTPGAPTDPGPAVPVAPQASKATAKAKYSKAKKRVAASTKVTVGGKAATGKVKLTLKRGKKTVKSVTKTLKNGSAAATFKKVSKKGKYSVVVTFAGDASQAKSTKKATFSVR